MSVKQTKLMIFLWFWLIFVGICHDFGWFLYYLDSDPFHKAVPDPGGQNATDPDSKLWIEKNGPSKGNN